MTIRKCSKGSCWNQGVLKRIGHKHQIDVDLFFCAVFRGSTVKYSVNFSIGHEEIAYTFPSFSLILSLYAILNQVDGQN
jgi:hypothetical protein